jgi:uncharacterized protein with von Willebrand factor type A (vWA) domain
VDAIGLEALDSSFSFLDEVPEGLFDAVVGHAGADLRTRVGAVESWRHALLAGRLPDPRPAWPDPRLTDGFAAVLAHLGLPRFCVGNTDLTNAVLRSLLEATAEAQTWAWVAEAEELRRLEELERRRVEDAAGKTPTPIPPDVLARLRVEACSVGLQRASSSARDAIAATWEPRVRLWAAIEDVFGSLGTQLGLGWDLSLGVLRSTGWAELVRLRALVERLDGLREVVRTLGRLRMAAESQDREVTMSSVVDRMRRATEVSEELASPFVPAETRGVTRSDEVSRMLPSETALLVHPVLRMLWHARRAERALCTYLVEGVMPSRVVVEVDDECRSEERSPRKERGPILVAIDTSGSMHGLPEHVAKAVALEAMRVAHQERRACRLFAWSGPGQVVEHGLSLDPGGVSALLEFLGLTFGGGTDPEAVVGRVLARLREEEWSRADLLIVTDGEFPVPLNAVEGVRKARADLGFRVQGLLVGNASSPAMDALCDAVACFRDWAAMVA